MSDAADPGATIPLSRSRKPVPGAGTGGIANPDASLPYIFGPEIARGGMGSILEAEDCRLPRTVAVKIVLSEIEADEDQKQRFMNEAAVLARLAHPNIVPVYDIGRDAEGQLYYSMKLVKGRTLQAILSDIRREVSDTAKHYTLDRLLTIFRKVCDAMAFSHSKGIIHRDLKPENIMVGEFGEVLVMDWGLAKALADSGELMADSRKPKSSDLSAISHQLSATLDGSVMGTPQYMSPEQAGGRIADMDGRSDIFSLGGILYCILTLRPPVEGKTLEEVLQKVSSGSITPPSAFGATTGKGRPGLKGEVLEARKIMPLPHCPGGRVPAALSAVAMQALSLDKSKRYQDVAAFSADIEAYQGGFATKAENAGLAKQFALLVRRHRGIFSTAAAAWLVITVLGVWFVLNLRAKEQRAIAGEHAAIVEKEAARRSAATANLSLADAAMREGDSAAIRTALDAVPEDLRDPTWSYLSDQSDTSIASIPGIDAVAPDPTRAGVFAVANRERKITIMDVRSGQRLLEFEAGLTKSTGSSSPHLAFSPDGERIAIACARGTSIAIHSARDGTKLLEWDAEASRQLDFSADGKLLLQHTGRNRAEAQQAMWDSATGQLRWKNDVKRDGYGAFTPNGQQVVATGGDGSIRLVNAQDGTLVREILDKSSGSFGAGMVRFVIGPGDMLALETITRGVVVLNWRQGRVVSRFQPDLVSKDSFDYLAWTPDGSRLVTAAMARDGRQVIRLWDPQTGWMTRALLGGSREVGDIAVHPLSGELLVAGSAGRAWSLTGVPPRWTLQRSAATRFVFWGSDDMVIGPGSRSLGAVQKVSPDGVTTLWTPQDDKARNPSVSDDGRWAVLVDPDKRLKKHLLLKREGERIEQVAEFKSSLLAQGARISPAGDQFLAFSSSQIELFAIPGGEEKARLDWTDISQAADFQWLTGHLVVGLVTAKGKRLEAEAEERVVLWDAATGKILQTAVYPSAMDVLTVAPDGRRFAEAGTDKKVRIRDAATLAVLREFRAHDGPITALAWHPTRPVLATASADLSVRLWDLDTGHRLEEFNGLTSPAANLTFSPSGQRLLGGGGDATRIWEPRSLSEKAATP